MATPSLSSTKKYSKRKLFKPLGRKDVAQPYPKRSRSSTFSLRDLKSPLIFLERPKDCDKFYNLLDICQLEQDEGESDSIYFCKWMKKHFSSLDKYQFESEYSILQEFEILVPFLVSTNMRIDVAVLDKNSCPLLLIEVCSNRYNDAIAHCAVSLIDHLRLIRVCDQSIISVRGFVLPNTSSSDKISLITITWNKLRYEIGIKFLNLKDMISEINNVLKSQNTFSSRYEQSWKDYFMGLSSSDISYLQNIINSDPIEHEQVESSFSILMKNEKYFYKISPDPAFESNLYLLNNFYQNAKTPKESFSHLVLPTNFIFTKTSLAIFQFDAQPHQPLSQSDAKKCLGDFVEQAIRALNELHDIGFAHCDVRLPNFCFSDKYEPMLIDFDRAVGIESSPIWEAPYFFEPPINQVALEGLDFKQFGLMIHVIISEPDSEDMILEGRIQTSDPFLKKLVEDGKYDIALYNNWRKSYEDKFPFTSCRDVIIERSKSTSLDVPSKIS